jgi:hypothetical protein
MIAFHECTHAYLFEFEDELPKGLKDQSENYYGDGSLVGGATEDPWLIAHESGADYVGQVVYVFTSLTLGMAALQNGVLPGIQAVIQQYIKNFRAVVARTVFGTVGDQETRIIKAMNPDLRSFLRSTIIPNVEPTGLLYCTTFSQILQTDPSTP